MNLEGKTAIVTGGAGALGAVVVGQFLAQGAHVAITVHAEHQLSSISKTYGADGAYAEVADISIEESVQSFVRHVIKRFQGIDCLVNIAGGYAGGSPIESVSSDEWEKMMSSNLRSAFFMCRACLPMMRARKFGRIVSIAAMPALTSGANKGPYAISKRGVIALTETIADEVKGTGITANAIAPSIILTEANKSSMPGADFNTWVTPEEIAHLILYLCSDDARSISGNTIRVYGAV